MALNLRSLRFAVNTGSKTCTDEPTPKKNRLVGYLHLKNRNSDSKDNKTNTQPQSTSTPQNEFPVPNKKFSVIDVCKRLTQTNDKESNVEHVLPNYLYGTFQKNAEKKQLWCKAKQKKSQNAAWKGILLREQLLEHKINLASKNIIQRQLGQLPLRISEVSRLNAQIRNESNQVFEPLMLCVEKFKIRLGEGASGSTQCLDMALRNTINSFCVLSGNTNLSIDPALFLEVNQVAKIFILQLMMTVLDPTGQVPADLLQSLTKPGQSIIRPKHMMIQCSGTTNSAQMKSRLCSIISICENLFSCIATVQKKAIEFNKQLQIIDERTDLSAQQKVLAIQSLQIKVNDAYATINKAVTDVVNCAYEMQDAILGMKGDTAHRKLKLKENFITGIARGVCTATIDPVSSAISAATNGIVPRADLLIRNFIIQPVALAVDFILAARFTRACHIKDPVGLLSKEAKSINLDKNLGNVNKYERTRIILEYIASSNEPKCIALRNNFKSLPWDHIEQGALNKPSILRDLANTLSIQGQKANACMREFSIDPQNIQQQISHYPQAKIARIRLNIKEEEAKLLRIKSNLYLQKKYIAADILEKEEHGGTSIYANEELAMKNRVKSQATVEQELEDVKTQIKNLDIDITDFERTRMYYEYVAKLTPEDIKNASDDGNIVNRETAIDIALLKKYPNINPAWKYSIENIYKRSVTLNYKSPILNHLRSYTHLVMRSSINDIQAPGVFRQKALFRQYQVQIFGTGALQELDQRNAEIYGMGVSTPEEQALHSWVHKFIYEQMVSVTTGGIIYPVQIAVAMATLQENMRRYGRTRHHDFYLGLFIKMAEFGLNQNTQEKNTNINKIYAANQNVKAAAEAFKNYRSDRYHNAQKNYTDYCAIIRKINYSNNTSDAENNLSKAERDLFNAMHDVGETYLQAKKRQLKLLRYDKGYNLVEQELEKQKNGLNLLLGNAQPFIDLINQGINGKKPENIVHLELSNQLYSMAAGLVKPREKFYQRTNIAGEHKDAIQTTIKMNRKIKLSENIPEFVRRFNAIYVKINKKEAEKLKAKHQKKSLELMNEFLLQNQEIQGAEQQGQMQTQSLAQSNIGTNNDNDANDINIAAKTIFERVKNKLKNKDKIKQRQKHAIHQFNAFGLLKNNINKYDINDIADVNCERLDLPSKIYDVCEVIYQEIKNKPKHLRVGDQGIFFGLIITLRDDIENKAKKLEEDLSKHLNGEFAQFTSITEQNTIRAYITAYREKVQAFNVFLSKSEKEIDGVMLPKKELDLGDENFAGEKYRIDFSNTRHHNHHIERDVYNDIAANLSTKKITIGKAKNYSKLTLKPLALGVMEIPKRLLQIPFLIVKAGTNYALSRRQAKKTRVQFEVNKHNMQGFINNQYKERFANPKLSNRLNTSKNASNTHKDISIQFNLNGQKNELELQEKAKLQGLNAYNFAPSDAKKVYELRAQNNDKLKINDVDKSENVHEYHTDMQNLQQRLDDLLIKYKVA